MWQDLGAAIALVLVIEGLLPFINPGGMRRAILMVSQLNDHTLRFLGLTSMMLGLLLLNLIR
jgi:uncharacterized protein YjeT (DUF2065 family)